ncbi:Putative acyl-CoA dehydrogenase FadE17 [BD1-7 clade bacterium]|uniref:Acyl-CoA dehydrogenase FadE17 n=1 Tax=BD1-7 clade bacterium TaxID=2029982 RepID=A0A5S9P3W0_9GAMM|nr:Putative acyl-CoA dehydrogenase FadE17 [BD1-7 clade bacterium]CAA0098270.1 Putative acyl-CoA dehydrogenase FadE17 [BD1-7 clade bacterium]
MDVCMSFAEEVSRWIADNCPNEMFTPMPVIEEVWGGRKEQFVNADAKVWLERVAEQGWLAPSWPKEYGGAGLDGDQVKTLKNTFKTAGCRPALMSLGIWMMGPTIMEFGNDEQKLRFLPDIAAGKTRWCQGYSEPGAGSDLASLSCKAELDTETNEYVVSGQKVWTSYADKSDYLFCLVRTDFSASKHNGISVLLIDMESQGVSTRPIRLISGASHFCEVFLDQVRVPAANLLGETNHGWSIAKRMLEHERKMMGQSDLTDNYNPVLSDFAKRYQGDENGRIDDLALRDRIAGNEIDIAALDLTNLRIKEEIKAGEFPIASTILKYAMTLAYQDKFELLLEILGNKGLGWEDLQSFSTDEERAAREFAFSKIQTIGGGTSEIQLNIIAKRVLGLPD